MAEIVEKLQFPNLRQAAATVPQGWTADNHVVAIWTKWLQVETDSSFEGIIFKRGDKTVRVPMAEIEAKLGLVW